MKTKLLPTLAILAILASAIVPLLAQDSGHRVAVVTMCYKHRTITVPTYMVPRWLSRGATPGACL